MKEDHQQSFNHQYHNNKKSKFKIFYPAAYVILLLLSYALGYFSAPSPRFPPPPAANAITQFSNTQLDNFRVTTHCADSLPSKLVRQTVLNRIYNSTSPYLNFPPPRVSSFLHSKRLKGWGSYGDVFSNLIQKVKPKVIIEVGTFLGASSLHMAELTRRLGLETQILCIDDFRGWPGFLDKFNGSALDKMCEWGIVGDLIEIDAGHDFNSAWADINRAYRILRPGGVIFGHDYFTAADNRGVRRAVNLFAQMNGLKIQTDGQHWVIDSAQIRSG
ncbi:uncharacterized protein LOC126686069 isoform X2 [Mercurialis annua]|uniref:uncharacterized protein LOC126686069 isoform X2 n=1 Tax=Mercurialis annua TaxID=3986 RepID=UPI00215FF230|nr:uncharacterized protein LOC126686069 isoform X2 [Mercurialis annua]